jgi:hypothetical protein
MKPASPPPKLPPAYERQGKTYRKPASSPPPKLPITPAYERQGKLFRSNEGFSFKIWIEELEAKREGIKGVILNYLKDKLNINDDEAILDMPLGSIDKKVLSDLLNRGLITTSNEDIMQDIQNGNGTIMDLIAKLAGGAPPQKLLVHKPPENTYGEPSG